MPGLWLLLSFALLPAVALAGDASVDMGKIEGVYRDRHRSGDSAGAKYMVTDVLEIVRVEKGALVHRDHDDAWADKPCEFHLVPKRGRITFEDIHSHCRRYCGARGSFGGAEFRIARRNTAALKRLRASSEYRAVVEEYRKDKKANP